MADGSQNKTSRPSVANISAARPSEEDRGGGGSPGAKGTSSATATPQPTKNALGNVSCWPYTYTR
jgi:hypothetical protein